MISVPERVLCLVAHPDDLEPQAGGTIYRFTSAGSRVHVINAAIPDFPDRDSEATNAATLIGATVDNLKAPSLEYNTATISVFDHLTTEFAPDLIITHHDIDSHQDHITVAQVANTVARRNHITVWQLSHSFPSGYLAHRPQPNLFVDITSVHKRKMAAVSMYKSQIARYSGHGLFPDNWLEVIEARDRYFGGMLNQDGHSATRYAEGFVVGKMVWKE